MGLSPLLIIGIGLVAQPSFVFGEKESQLDSPRNDYSKGLALALLAAFLGGLCPVLLANSKRLPRSYSMLWSGIAKLSVGLFSPAVGLPNSLTDTSKYGEDFGVLAMVAGASMLGYFFYQLAVTQSDNPLLVQVTRTMEIVMSLGWEMMTLDINYQEMAFWLKFLGGLMVTACVILMALAEVIEGRLIRARIMQERLDVEEIVILIQDDLDFEVY